MNESVVLDRDRFYRRLYRYREEIGQPIVRVPTLGFKELDLWILYREVIGRGGFDAVIAKKQWKEVRERHGLDEDRVDFTWRYFMGRVAFCDSEWICVS